MMEGSSSRKKRGGGPKDDFINLVFSWSIDDILDDTLYQNQVEKIPESFDDVYHYLGSFPFPLLEETRADIAASLEVVNKAPFGELISFNEVEPYGELLFGVTVDYWRNLFGDGRERYRTLPGDIVIISDAKPETKSDLQRVGWNWTFASVTDISDNENDGLSASTNFKAKAARDIGISEGMQKSYYIVFLVNVIPSKRVWNALGMRKNLNIIKKVLYTGHEELRTLEQLKHCALNQLKQWTKQGEDKCDVCSASVNDGPAGEVINTLLSKLNDSQAKAIMTSLDTLKCHHKPSVQLIWGPPGTGKTKTTSVMLFILLKMNGNYYDVLFHVLRNNDVRNQLPKDIYGILVSGVKRNRIQISEIGKAFQIARDPLLFVNLGENTTRHYSNVIHVQLGTDHIIDDIFDSLFPARNVSQAPYSSVPTVMTIPFANSPLNNGDQPKILTTPFSEVSPQSKKDLQQMNWDLFLEISDFLKHIGCENDGTTSTVAQKMKEEINMHIKFLTAAMEKPDAGEDMIEEVRSMLQDLQQLNSLLDTSNSEVANAEQLLKSLLSRKPKLEALLNQCIVLPSEKDCEEKSDTVCGEVEKIESSSVTTNTGSNAERKQPEKGKGKSRRPKKGKGKRKK